MLNTPILLITFNRPDHTRQTLLRILEAHPHDLYIFQDGARDGNANDAIKCQQVRDVISELIGCASLSVGQQTIRCTQDTVRSTLHFYGSSINLGCGAGPMTGISWFFDHVEQGIVMEDDCLAHPDFFPYCEELLNRYKGTEVKFINSTLYDDRWTKALNPMGPPMTASVSDSQWGERSASTAFKSGQDFCADRVQQAVSYGFSRYMVTGAWASYREVWKGFDLDLRNMSALKFALHVYRMTGNLAEAEWWWYQVRAIQQDKNKKSYWDYQMQIHLFQQIALTIHPAVNLISNIGFDAEGTHTKGNDGRGDREVYPILPLNHPTNVSSNAERDMHCWAKKQSKGLLKDMLYIIYHLYSWRKKYVR